jgi:O-antigen/teichoic acid export membrane protein
MDVYALGQLIEQIIRIILLYIFVKPALEKSIIDGVIAAILTLSISELIQNMYLLIRVFMFTKVKNKTTIKTDFKEIIKPSFSLTSNKLFASVTSFLEPIIYTYAFLKTGLSTEIADELYAIIYGYSIPIILTTNFITIAIETAILPTLTKHHIENNQKELNNIVKKALTSIIISSLLFLIH